MEKLGFEPRSVQQQSTCSLDSVILLSSGEKASLRNRKTKRNIQSDLFLLGVVAHTGTKTDESAPKEDRTEIKVLEDRSPTFPTLLQDGSHSRHSEIQNLSVDEGGEQITQWPLTSFGHSSCVLCSQKPVFVSEIHLTSQTPLASVHMLTHMDSDRIQ